MRSYHRSLLFILLLTPLLAIGQSVTMTRYQTTKNVKYAGQQCFKLSADFKLSHLKNRQIKVRFEIEYPKGRALSTSSGQAFAEGNIKAPYNETTAKDLQFHIAYSHFLTSNLYGKSLYGHLTATLGNRRLLDEYIRFSIPRPSNQSSETSKTPKPQSPRPSQPVSNQGITDYRVETEDCPICHGTTFCSNCHGAGKFVGRYGTGVLPCNLCYQTGKCRYCDGTGKQIREYWKENGIPYVRYNHGAKQVIGPDSNDTNGHECRGCHGSGECQACGGSGNAISYVAGTSEKCRACGGTGKCSICKGAGWRD